MPSFKLMLWVIRIELLLIPILPVLAAEVNRRSGRFIQCPWMGRLRVLLTYILVVNLVLLGMGFQRIHNLWLENLALLPEMGLTLWVLSALGQRALPKWVAWGSLTLTLACMALDVTHYGLRQSWQTAIIASTLQLFLMVVWRLQEWVIRYKNENASSQPELWLLASWAINQGNTLFYAPFSALFLKHLSRTWILVPGVVYNLIGLIFSLTLSRTFLCRNQPSS